jgi:uncharacterized membrane protein
MDVSAFVFLHVTAGTAALLSGGTAILARKGETLHRWAGSVFFVAMIAMCTAAIPVAIVRYQPLNITAATLTLYLIATAWVAATRKDGETGAFERYAAVAGATIAGGTLLYAATLAKGAAPFMYGFGGIAAFAVLLDVSVIARRGLSGTQRIARHLWRMTFAMLIATASFFIGQAKFIPLVIRDMNLHFVPPIAVIALLLFWIVRVLLTNWANQTNDAAAPPTT